MRRIAFLSTLFLLLFVAGYIYWFYFNSFSDGSREGVLIKFSRKGNIFKTYEGELVQPGFRSVQGGVINSNVFLFSVSDISLAAKLNNASGKTIKVHYVQYRKCLPWRGENYNGRNQENGQYMIDRIEDISNPTPVQGL
jgi:hypothetical protein